MKPIFLITLVLLFSCNNSTKPREYEYTLVDYKPATLHCGVFSVWTGVRFKEKGSTKECVVLIQCLEMYEDSFFEVGKDYIIQLDKKRKLDETKHLISNYFKHEKIDVYVAEKIDKTKRNGQ